MTAEEIVRAPSVMERLARRVGMFVEADRILRSRLDRVLSMAGLPPSEVGPAEQSLVGALRAAGIVIVDDVSGPQADVALVPAQRHASPKLSVVPSDGRSGEDLEEARAAALRLLTSPHTRPRLLRAMEEVGLASLMRGDRYPLSADLPEDFRTSLDDSSIEARAYDTFVLRNLGLVRSIAAKNLGESTSSVDLDDLIGYGTLGLMRAVRKFDATLGYKFSTYATRWIEQHVSRGVMDEGRVIRLPVHLQEKIRRTRKAYGIIQARGLAPTPVRLAAETGFDLAEVVSHMSFLTGVVSLDLAVGPDGSAGLGDFLGRADTGFAELFDRDRSRNIGRLLDEALSGREAAVIRLRFGLGGEEPMTLDEIGRVFNVTRERIRQIESAAFNKLRQPSRKDLLAAF